MWDPPDNLQRPLSVVATLLLLLPVLGLQADGAERTSPLAGVGARQGWQQPEDGLSLPLINDGLLFESSRSTVPESPIQLISFHSARDEADFTPSAVNLASAQDYLPEYDWELLPAGIIFHSYLAGEKEPRFASQWLWDENRGMIWETALGGRWGIVRYGTPGPISPQGFQLDVEGAALARVDPEEVSTALEAADFRVGIVGTYRVDRWRTKAGFYHLSSHIGDEYLLLHPTFRRRNYVRDSVLAAVMYDVTRELQVYGEIGYAFNANDGAEPLELQFGAQFSKPDATGPKGFPFIAINEHWREEFSGELSTNIMAGWMWRGKRSDAIFRFGFQHYSGRALQYEFFDRQENLNGLGIWFDF